MIKVITGKPEYDNFYPIVKSFLEQDVMEMTIDGKKIRGYRTPDAASLWIRDYSDMLRAVKYFEKDLISVVEHFAETQAQNGRIFDYFTTSPEKLPCEKENWTKYVRVPVEADVEYRFIKAAFLAWQATGDDQWIQQMLPFMEKALMYIINSPQRWDKEHGLVKRAYTIDTWDFAYTADKHNWLQFQIDDNTFWGYMHGDNSGYYEAFQIMAMLFQYLDQPEKASLWLNHSINLRKAMNSICWNGSFYTHFTKISPVQIDGVDESKQISLSNPMNINRGTTSHKMAVSIISEYRKRKEIKESFAEWYSIDPPFPDGIFGDEKLVGGAYVNGGIMPLVGGELAKAAFDHGFESYGVDILSRYYMMISEKNESYLWYFPDGTPASIEKSTSPDAMPTDAWGSSAMLYAFVEGLAGIEDKLNRFGKVKLSPRWLAAGISECEIITGYKASETKFSYIYTFTADSLSLEIKCGNSLIDFHVLIPSGIEVKGVKVNGLRSDFHTNFVEKSKYVDFVSNIYDISDIVIEFS